MYLLGSLAFLLVLSCMVLNTVKHLIFAASKFGDLKEGERY